MAVDPSVQEQSEQPEQATTGGPPTVDIGWGDVTLEEPPALLDVAVRLTPRQVASNDEAAALARGAAALFLCWPAKKRWPAPRPKPWVPGEHIWEYGQAVYAGLRKATKSRCPKTKLHVMLYRALTWTFDAGMTEEELREARNFSEGQGEE